MSDIFNGQEKAEETSLEALVATHAESKIAEWTDEKKKDFVETFDKRVRVAKSLLLLTVDEITDTAHRRKFISRKHLKKLGIESNNGNYHRHRLDWDGGNYCVRRLVGGRDIHDLQEIAKSRAEAIIRELPPLKKAVELIDAETAKKITKSEQLKQKGQELADKLSDICEPIAMKDLDQSMTIGEFRDMVKKQDKLRRRLVEQMEDIAKEGRDLEDSIAKALYKGLPGLSDAIVDVIQTHLDRAKSLDGLNRRVEEEVQFGDCKEAMDMLEHFQKDEPEVVANVKKEFKAALDKLRLSSRGKGKKRATKQISSAKPRRSKS